VIAGGEYSPSSLDFEDYILVCSGFETFSDAVEALVETRYCLGELLREKFGPVPTIGGGAYAPSINDTEEAFDVMLAAIEKVGLAKKILLGLDVAGSELYNEKNRRYKVKGKEITADELAEYYKALTKQYPLVFIEDPFQEDDFEGFARLTSALPQVQIVGDDLFVTNPTRIKKGIEKKAGNTILLKVNQIGTLSEACDAAFLARQDNYHIAVSMRSSDTNDDFISDLAVGLGAGQIKLGSPVSGERNAKYNRLLEIEQELGAEAKFAGKDYFRNSP
jgi:enolase